jgi:hypothetical protein
MRSSFKCNGYRYSIREATYYLSREKATGLCFRAAINLLFRRHGIFNFFEIVIFVARKVLLGYAEKPFYSGESVTGAGVLTL